MSNIFDERTFNEQEKSNIKAIVDDAVEVLQEIEDLQNHLKENIKGLCDSLNEGYSNDLKIKPTLIRNIAKAKLKEKEDVEKKKTELNEVEEGLEILYHI